MCTNCENCNCNDDPTIVQINGTPGTNGFNGWTPLLSNIKDGSRIVQQIIGWTGGTGTPPSSTNQFIGSSGIVNTAAAAKDIRGSIGFTGSSGNAAWIAVLANVVDGDRVVQQIVDWFGGGGTKPSIVNQFIGPIGIVNTTGAATDIRGAEGPQGEPGEDVTDGRLKITSSDTTLDYLSNKIVTDGRIVQGVGSMGGNETLNLAIAPIYQHQFSASPVNLTTSYVGLLSYSTPNDGISRIYTINFDGLGYIVELDAGGRVSGYYAELIIGGVTIKEVFNVGLSLAGYSRSERSLSLNYVGQIDPNISIEIKVKKLDLPTSTVRIANYTLSIFGI